MDTSRGNVFKRHPVIMYFILAFVITWLILSPGVAATLGLLDFQFNGAVLTFLAGIGPLLAAIIVTGATKGGEGVRNIFRSMFHWRVGVGWWAAAVLLPAGLFALAIGIGVLSGSPLPNPSMGSILPGGSLIIVVILILIGSFGEEPGWRGFALPRLQEGRNPLVATIILVVFWWLFHLPALWVMPPWVDSVRQQGFIPVYGMLLIFLLAVGILTAWVYNRSGGSVLMPILLHVSFHLWGSAFGTSMYFPLLFVLWAVVVAIATKGKLGLRST